MVTGRDLGRPLEILLVEDSAADALLTREALKRADVVHHLNHVSDGVQALQFLRREGEFADVQRPDVILLDLNMPRKGGLEVLEELRDDDELRKIPTIVLTTSANDQDVDSAYGLAANCYLAKPVDLGDFVEAMRSMSHLCLNWVCLPTNQL